MPKNSFLSALFQGPKFSIAPIEHNNRGSLKIGDTVPVFSTILNPREGIQLDMAHLVRFMPAKVPVMEGYKVTFDAFAVPYSCLGYAERKERDIDDFFNIKENGGEVPNPFCHPMYAFLPGHRYGVEFTRGAASENNRKYLAEAFRLHSLGDYINFPSLKGVRDHVRKWLDLNALAYGNGIERWVTLVDSSYYVEPLRFAHLALLNYPDVYESDTFSMSFQDGDVVLHFGVPFTTDKSAVVFGDPSANATLYYDYIAGTQNDTFYDSVVPVRSLLGYILENYPAVSQYYGYNQVKDNDYISSYVSAWILDLGNNWDNYNPDYLQVLYDYYKIDAQSIYNEWFDDVMSKLLYAPDIINTENEKLYELSGDPAEGAFLPFLASTDEVDLSYLAAYWKIISDWYINTNIDGDPETFFLEHCRLLSQTEPDGDLAEHYDLDLQPFHRRWGNDIFTSSVPMAQVQNVRIPADGTIPDLREANAYQKLVDIFRNTGRRLRDVVYGVFGITPSAVRSEMSEPIGSISSWIGFQSVLQTSETTEKSPQAAYAGIGTVTQGHSRILKYVNNDEPTPVIIMILMSVTQRASYMQGFDKKFFRKSIYDFAVPQLAMIGEEEVTNKELYFDKGYNGGTFGFNRRYYSWFYSGSEVHGELRDTEDYWHGARIFDEQPALNSEFIGIESETDHLQRVFANTSEAAAPIRYNLNFDGYKTVALPRYIQYEL